MQGMKSITTNHTYMATRKGMSEDVFHLYHRKYLNMLYKNLRVPQLENLTMLNNWIQESDTLSFLLNRIMYYMFLGFKFTL